MGVEDKKHYLENDISGSETEFLKNWHEANMKQWKDTLDLCFSIQISRLAGQIRSP